MTKSRTLLWLLLMAPAALLAQVQERQMDDTTVMSEPLIPVSKQSLLSNVDVIANMQMSFQNEFEEGTYQRSRFVMNQFRLEIRGKVHDKVYFRFRDRYTRGVVPQSIDNISRSTDLAFLRFDPNESWSIYAGKMCADWGGYEFDANPIEIYEYSDIVEYADNFLVGAGVSYMLPDRQNQFTFQLLNSRTASFNELYDTLALPGVKSARFPFASVLNWRGNFGKFSTLWSYSLFREAEDEYMNYLALGNQFSTKKFQIQYDFKWSREALDRKGIISSITDNAGIKHAYRARYMSHWVRMDWHLSSKVNLFVVGMMDDAYWSPKGTSLPDNASTVKMRTAWGYIPGVEVYPFKNLNLKVFGTFIGRKYVYTDYAKSNFGSVNTDNYRASIGIISPLVIL
ncbi:porin [Chitinophaga sp.]|uniref:porin n=1 Tax=Chitinophaga sp. TaxID=1869181 RepID=UPI0026324D05|nr:porin [uncultured Chitinophaga sp.]